MLLKLRNILTHSFTKTNKQTNTQTKPLTSLLYMIHAAPPWTLHPASDHGLEGEKDKYRALEEMTMDAVMEI